MMHIYIDLNDEGSTRTYAELPELATTYWNLPEPATTYWNLPELMTRCARTLPVCDCISVGKDSPVQELVGMVVI